MNLEVGTPLWADGFGVVTWVGAERTGFALLAGGIPKIAGHAPHEAVLYWAQRWLDLRSQGLVVEVPNRGILEESKGDEK